MRLVLLTCLVVLFVSSALLGDDSADRIPIPDEVFYYEPAASVHGPEAGWTNPAGLGAFQAAGFQLMADYYRGDYAKSWSSIVFRDRLVTGYRHINNDGGDDFDEWLAAGGLALGQSLRVGLSYRYFRNGPGPYNNRHYWTLGSIFVGKGSFKLAGVWTNLNKGKVDGEETAVEHRYSLAYRGLSPKLILSADMLLSSRMSVNDADFVYHAEYTPTPGLYVSGYVDSDKNFQIGVRANFLRYFMGVRSSFDRKGHDGRSTVYLGATNEKQPSLVRHSPRRLVMGLSGAYAENPPRPVFGGGGTAFATILLSIYRAADDPSIGEMTLRLSGLSLGFGQAQELREALQNFSSRGKRIICHLSSPNNIGYYVATAADTILIPPVSRLNLVGLRAELTFFAGTLEKLGARVELLRVGDYKSAPEQYTREESSEEYREEINSLLDDLYGQFVAAIADGRGISPDSIKSVIDRGPFTSEEARTLGLVDGLSYWDRVDGDFGGSLPVVSFGRYLGDTLSTDDWPGPPTVAVVVAEGEIRSDGGSDNPLGQAGGVTPSPMAGAFAVVRGDSDIRSTVFRINSPGGSALAGEEIHREVARAAEAKPMVVSMANVAASGGYYIATPASQVFVDPATITGSIGIYGGKLDLSGLYEKLSVGKELYTRGKFAGMMTTMRPFTDEERSKYLSHLQAFYDHFVSLVADSRGLADDSVDVLGRGKVWTGREAVDIGLADETGGLKTAIDRAAEAAGLSEYRIRLLPEKRPWLLFPGRSLIGRLVSMFAGGESLVDAASMIPSFNEDDYLLARLPYSISIE